MRLNRLLTLIMIMLLLVVTGCSEPAKDEDVAVNLFNMQKADSIAKDYLNNVIAGDFSKADLLLSTELSEGNKDSGEGVSDIISFKQDTSIEGSNYGYFIYNVIRSSTLEPKSDLENITFQIKKADGEYKIYEIKSKSEKEVYTKGSGLRIIGEEGGKSSLILSLNSLPKDTYLRDNKIMIYKDKVPSDYFGKVCLSFTGKRIAVTTTNNQDSYICIAYIDEAIMSSTLPSDQGGNSETDVSGSNMDALEEALEKPIAQKVVSVDLLKDSKVTKFIFSEKEETLQVSYNNKYNKERIRLYNSDNGDFMSSEIDSMFPEDKYSITDGKFNNDQFTFKVSNTLDDNDSANGEYSLNLRILSINKL